MPELGRQWGVTWPLPPQMPWPRFLRLLRHPAHMQPIVGTTNPGRVRDICKASGVKLTRQEWYDIYLAAGNKLP